MKLERVYFSTIAERLGTATHTQIFVGHINILVSGWNKQRIRHGRSPINFAQRVKDEVEWQKKHNQPINRERFMYIDELALFSRYAGYDLTKPTTDNQ